MLIDVTKYYDEEQCAFDVKRLHTDATRMAKKRMVVLAWETTSLLEGDETGWTVVHTQKVFECLVEAFNAAYADMKIRRPQLCGASPVCVWYYPKPSHA